MLNVVALTGRLVHTPELRHTESGVAVCRFSIAVDRSHASADGDRPVDFIDIVAWRKTAEFVCNYFGKGRMIAVDGALQTRKYEDKQGVKRTAVEVVANNVHFAGDKPQDGVGAPQRTMQSASPYQSPKFPVPAPYSSASPPAPKQTALTDSFSAGSDDDFSVIDDVDGDIPF